MPSGSTTTFAARRPSAVPRSPNRPRPTSSACGPVVRRARPLRHGTRVRPLRPDLRGSDREGLLDHRRKHVHNEIWDRVHTLAGGTREAAERYDSVPFLARTLGVEISRAGPSWPKVSREPRSSRHSGGRATREPGKPQVRVACPPRCREALLELGGARRRRRSLPPPSLGKDLQDIVYDTPARVGVAVALERGRKRQSTAGERPATTSCPHPWDGVHAVEGLLAGGIAGRGGSRAPPSRRAQVDLGQPGLDFADGRILLAPDGQQKRGRSWSDALASPRVRPPALGLARRSARG